MTHINCTKPRIFIAETGTKRVAKSRVGAAAVQSPNIPRKVGIQMTEVMFAQLAGLDLDAAGVAAGRLIWQCDSVNRFSTGRTNNLLFYQMSGERQYYLDGQPTFRLRAGELIFIPVGSVYLSRVEGCSESEGIFVDFELSLDRQIVYIAEPFRRFADDGRFIGLFQTASKRGGLRVKAALYDILAELSDLSRTHALKHGEFASLAPAILALESRLDEPVDIASLARLCCMSETSFREKFKRFTGGVAPLEYRSRLRIERADELLRSGSFTVAEVAASLGFFDTAHFCRTYKKLRGVPPGGALPHSSQ